MIEVNTKELGSVSFPHHVAQFAIDYAEYYHILYDHGGNHNYDHRGNRNSPA